MIRNLCARVLSGRRLAIESSHGGSVIWSYDSEYRSTCHEPTVSSFVVGQPPGVDTGAGSFAGGCARGTRSPVTDAPGAAVTRLIWRKAFARASSSCSREKRVCTDGWIVRDNQ